MVDWLRAGDEARELLLGDIGAFRERRRSVLLIPYESLDPVPWHLGDGFAERLESRLSGEFRLGPHALPSIVEPFDWSTYVRPFALHLDSFEPISELLMGYSLTGEQRYLDGAFTFAWGWLRQFHAASMAIGPVPAKLDAALGPMRWFDMSTGFRVYRLAYIADVIARNERFDDQDVRIAVESLILHLQLLSIDEFYQGHNNHGFFQAFGELATCRRFCDEPFFRERFAIAEERVHAIVAQQFHPSGVHREHSPGYHLMVFGALLGAYNSGFLTFEGAAELVKNCEHVLTWLIQPGGALLTFGDTDPRVMNSGRFPSEWFSDPGLRFSLSAGAIGEPLKRGIEVLKDEGYVFARSDTPTDRGDTWWYLAQIAAFQSRIHKHADDLSFVWSDARSQILIDPGSFGRAKKTEKDSELADDGFWYAGDERVYVESTRAHNTVEIDGRPYDRKRDPYGSALIYAGEQSDLIVTECEILQFETVRHWRLLVMAPGRFLLVIDRLSDQTGELHDYRQHFHFHPDWSLLLDPESGRVTASRSKPTRRVSVISLVPETAPLRTVRGQTEPNLLGWTSDKAWSLVPCGTVVVEQLQTAESSFATLFSFGGKPKPYPKRTHIRRDPRPSTFAWREGGSHMKIEVTRGNGNEPVSVELIEE